MSGLLPLAAFVITLQGLVSLILFLLIAGCNYRWEWFWRTGEQYPDGAVLTCIVDACDAHRILAEQFARKFIGQLNAGLAELKG